MSTKAIKQLSEKLDNRGLGRTYRFAPPLYEWFEEECARGLSNPRGVLEALALMWLEADEAKRRGLGQQWFEWEQQNLRKGDEERAEDQVVSLARTYRFDPELWGQFETDCRKRLFDLRRIIDATILFWLKSDAKVRQKIAERRHQWVGQQR